MKTNKPLLIMAATWAMLPWLFWFVYSFHQPDHADAFWLPAMPFVFISFVPMYLVHGTSDPNWFPLRWVIGSLAFNLVIGAVCIFAVNALRRRRNA